MKISTILCLSLFFFFFSFTVFPVQGLEPSPAPDSGDGVVSHSNLSPSLTVSPAPDSSFFKFSPPSPPLDGFPAPENGSGGAEGENPGDVVPSPASTEETGSDAVRWCAVRDGEFDDCATFVSVFKQSQGYTWKCVNRDTTQVCLESIKKGEADLVNLEAGLAYVAFRNYSMKAIANEVYCDQAKSYLAVAVVNRKICEDKEGVSLLDFKGKRSCHGGYSTAVGWNYPITHIKRLFDSVKLNDQEIATSFFSKVCAPSEFEGSGVCNGCGDESDLCPANSLYFGHSGAFRCLVEGMGDIAFVKEDTTLLYSMEGPHNQTWSTKSVRDFMYLCPQGGCREINGYPGACSYGSVPANVIMASNSISTKKKLFVLETLTNATNRGKASAIHLFNPSTQGLSTAKTVTRSYLGKSASVSQSIQQSNTPKSQATSAPKSDGSSNLCVLHSTGIVLISIMSLLFLFSL